MRREAQEVVDLPDLTPRGFDSNPEKDARTTRLKKWYRVCLLLDQAALEVEVSLSRRSQRAGAIRTLAFMNALCKTRSEEHGRYNQKRAWKAYDWLQYSGLIARRSAEEEGDMKRLLKSLHRECRGKDYEVTAEFSSP